MWSVRVVPGANRPCSSHSVRKYPESTAWAGSVSANVDVFGIIVAWFIVITMVVTSAALFWISQR